MIFNNHSSLEGKHAFLGASNYHWLAYDAKKLEERYYTYLAKERGTRLHAFAAEAIKLGIKLKGNKMTLSQYVNDAIGYGMLPEVILYYSDNCFGTADAISFDGKLLRIHDLKTGESPTNLKQLRIYAAIFCLEYSIDPRTIDIELRIYQYDDYVFENPDPDQILTIMDQIVKFDKRINKIKLGA